MNENSFKINLEEIFPRLVKAPVVEAVIDIRTIAKVPWEEQSFKDRIIKALPEYPQHESFHNYQTEFAIKKQEKQPVAQQYVKNLGWKGLRLKTQDKKNIVQFNNNGLAFSRLMPYEKWDIFCKEALRLWNIYISFSKCIDIHRIGVRYINKIITPTDDIELNDYFREAPQPPNGLELPFIGFLHQDTFLVPGYNYKMNIIKTIQQHVMNEQKGLGLIVDIDVFYEERFDIDNDVLEVKLNEMRYLKNKAFFGTITNKALEILK